MERGVKKKLAEHKDSVILVADEMNLNQETKTKNIWYFRNKEPIVQAKRKGESQNFYGALNIKTGQETAIKPELNPQEHVWKSLRQNITHNRLEKDFSVLIKDCLRFLNHTDFSSIQFRDLFG